MTHGGVLTIADGAKLSLYWQEGGNVFMNTDSVVIEEKSGLHIGKTELARLSGVRQWVNVATEVKEGGTLSLEGVVGFTSAARVDSSGTVRISDFAQVGTLSSVTQKGGEISIGNGAELVMGEGTELTLKDAVLTSSGFLSAPALKTENSQLSLQSGGIRDSSVTLWETGGSTEVSLEAGARLTVDELKGEGLRFTVAGDSAAYSAASFGDYSEVKNSQFVVASSGLLVLGAHEIGFGLQDTLDAVERLSPLEGRAVLAVNDSVRLAAGSSLSVGSDKTLQSGADSTVTLGKDSVLIILPELTSAAFSGGESGLAVVKEEGAQVYVLDALQKTWVADAGVEWDKPFEDTEIVSANRNVVLEMRKEKDNWVIAAKEVLTNQFVYPTLQGTLYQGDISVDSDNASERFFARADNMEFIDEAADAPALIAEVTQQSVLLGVRNTALSAAGLHEKARSVVLDAMPEGTLRPLVYLQGERRDARKLGGYLGDAGYTAKSTGIVIGGEYYPRSDTRLSLTAAGSRITTDAKKSVLAAKGRQNVYGAEFEAVSSFGAFNFGGRAGASWFKTKMNGQLPEKMDMGASFGKHRETLLSASLFAEARVHPNISLTLSPTLWHFSGDTVSTSLGGESAFSQNIESKNLFEIPLGVKVHKKTRLKSGWDLGVAAEADGALRLGSLSQKSRLHAAGTGAYENISQREFSRWKSGVDLSFSASKKNFEARGELGVSRGTRETAFGGGVRLNWKF
jgi:hypothetical protein